MQTSNTLIKIALPCARDDKANKNKYVCYKSSSATSLFSFPFFCNESSRKNYSSFKQNRRENVKRTCRGASWYNTFNFPKKAKASGQTLTPTNFNPKKLWVHYEKYKINFKKPSTLALWQLLPRIWRIYNIKFFQKDRFQKFSSFDISMINN